MKHSILLGSTALLFLLVLAQIISFLIKNQVREIDFPVKEEGAVAVELIVENEVQGVYFFRGHNTVAASLNIVNKDWDGGEKDLITPGMSLRIRQNHLHSVGEMQPHQKLALGIPVDINRLAPEEIMLIPGIGEKTALAIHAYIRNKGCIRDLSELTELRGIKERKIANMRKYLITNPDNCQQSTPRT